MQRCVSVILLALAESEFPRLMEHRTNREDAIQTLALVQFATRGEHALEIARHALSWLEYELGVVPVPPSCPRPEFSPQGNHKTAGLYRQDLSGDEVEVLFGCAAA